MEKAGCELDRDLAVLHQGPCSASGTGTTSNAWDSGGFTSWTSPQDENNNNNNVIEEPDPWEDQGRKKKLFEGTE